jgi:hypothetical protein
MLLAPMADLIDHPSEKASIDFLRPIDPGQVARFTDEAAFLPGDGSDFARQTLTRA